MCHGGDLEQLWSLEGSPDGPPAIFAEIIAQLQQRTGALSTPGLFLSACTLADVVQLALAPAPGGGGGLQEWKLQPGQPATEASILKEISLGKHPATKRLSRGDSGRVKAFLKCHPPVASRVLAVQQAVMALDEAVRKYAKALSDRVAAAEGAGKDASGPIDDPNALPAAQKEVFLRHAASMAAVTPGGDGTASGTVRIARADHRPSLSELWPATRLRQAVAPIVEGESDPLVLAGLLMECLRNLKHPLIPSALASAFSAAVAESDPPLSQHAQLVALRGAVACLPPPNRLTLQAITEVCALDVLHPDNAHGNGLRADVLSSVLAPLVLPPSVVQLPYSGVTLTGLSLRSGGQGGQNRRMIARPVDVSEGSSVLRHLTSDAALVLRSDSTRSESQPLQGDSFVIPATRGGNTATEPTQGGVHLASSPTPSVDSALPGAAAQGASGVGGGAGATLHTVPEQSEGTSSTSPPAGVPVSHTETGTAQPYTAEAGGSPPGGAAAPPPPLVVVGGPGSSALGEPVSVPHAATARGTVPQATPGPNAHHQGSARTAVAVGSLTPALAESYAIAVVRLLLAHFATLFHGTNADALECEMLSTQEQSRNLVAARWALRTARAREENTEQRRTMSAAVALQRLKLKRTMAAWRRLASQGRGRDAVHDRVRLLSTLAGELSAEVDEQAVLIERLQSQLREAQLKLSLQRH